MLVSVTSRGTYGAEKDQQKACPFFTKTLPKLQQTHAGITPYSPRSPRGCRIVRR